VARLLAALPAGEVERWGIDPADTFLVHRLDAGTSGVVLLARGAEAHRRAPQPACRIPVGDPFLVCPRGRRLRSGHRRSHSRCAALALLDDRPALPPIGAVDGPLAL